MPKAKIYKKDKFVGDDLNVYFPICNSCKNKYRGNRCRAFNEIPRGILTGEIDHDKPLPGQSNNIVFEPEEKKGMEVM